MELRDMKYFCTAAELGSVTKAATALGVSQPFVTKIITQMEREIGTQLFDIESRHIVLNQYVETCYKSARDILNQVDALIAKMDEMLGRSENTISFMFNTSGYLEPIVTAFRAKYPERSISMTFAIGSALAAIAGVLLCSTVPTLQQLTEIQLERIVCDGIPADILAAGITADETPKNKSEERNQ